MLPMIIIALFIVGCSSSQTDVDKKVMGEFDNAPIWIKTQQLPGKISALGKATKGSLTFNEQRDAAISSAQDELSKKVQVKLIDVFKILSDESVDTKLYEEHVSLATQEIVNNALKNSKIMKLWQSYSKNIYVLVATDIQKIKDDIKISVATDFRDMPNIKSNFTLKLEQGDINLKLTH